MSIGKLYRVGDEQSVVGINYQLRGGSATSWWGEFTLKEYRRLDDGARYIIELEDGRKGMCSIRKEVHRATTGIPTRYRYSFNGSGLLK